MIQNGLRRGKSLASFSYPFVYTPHLATPRRVRELVIFQIPKDGPWHLAFWVPSMKVNGKLNLCPVPCVQGVSLAGASDRSRRRRRDQPCELYERILCHPAASRVFRDPHEIHTVGTSYEMLPVRARIAWKCVAGFQVLQCSGSQHHILDIRPMLAVARQSSNGSPDEACICRTGSSPLRMPPFWPKGPVKDLKTFEATCTWGMGPRVERWF